MHQNVFACCRKGREPSWLAQLLPKPWPKLSGTTLVMGDASGPNPTHALNLNFYHMYRWMNKASNNSWYTVLAIISSILAIFYIPSELTFTASFQLYCKQ